jgi:hypothetical protein
VAALDEAPTEKATASAKAAEIEPLRRQLAALRDMATKLLAAEKALQVYNVDAAQEKLTAAVAAGAESQPLAMKLELLGEVVDQVRSEQDKYLALTVRRDEQLETVQNMLAVADAQDEVWESFVAALTSFLAGEEAGNIAIRKVAADPAGLPAAAAALVGDLSRELGEWASRPAADEARRVLSAAQASFAAADYVTAATLLNQLRGMTGAADPVVAAEANSLGARIATVEAEAAALYAEATAAYESNDAERVREAITKLKTEYANTKAYREHM